MRWSAGCTFVVLDWVIAAMRRRGAGATAGADRAGGGSASGADSIVRVLKLRTGWVGTVSTLARKLMGAPSSTARCASNTAAVSASSTLSGAVRDEPARIFSMETRI